MISGPRQLGNDIYVYPSPLIEDLNFFWDKGINFNDAYSSENSKDIKHVIYMNLILVFPRLDLRKRPLTMGIEDCGRLLTGSMSLKFLTNL